MLQHWDVSFSNAVCLLFCTCMSVYVIQLKIIFNTSHFLWLLSSSKARSVWQIEKENCFMLWLQTMLLQLASVHVGTTVSKVHLTGNIWITFCLIHRVHLISRYGNVFSNVKSWKRTMVVVIIWFIYTFFCLGGGWGLGDKGTVFLQCYEK